MDFSSLYHNKQQFLSLYHMQVFPQNVGQDSVPNLIEAHYTQASH